VAEIRSQSVVKKEDRFIEEDCLVDWAFPPIYDTSPEKEVNFIHQIDFLGVNAILSKAFNQRSGKNFFYQRVDMSL
jgi:hypothetical protein